MTFVSFFAFLDRSVSDEGRVCCATVAKEIKDKAAMISLVFMIIAFGTHHKKAMPTL